MPEPFIFAGNVYSIKPVVSGSTINHESFNVAGDVAKADNPVPVNPELLIVYAALLPPYTGLDVADIGVIN